MSISVIVPAHDAASTIRETLDALCAQSYGDWEAVVVDDGSSDDTASIVAAYAEREPRIRLVRQAQAGEGGARNGGIPHARYEWLLFLDADDWIVAHALERWSAAVARDPKVDAVHAGWVFVDTDGRIFGEHCCEHTGDLFPLLARHALFPVHACVVRRDIIRRLGGFDTTLKTCADWDMWQRVARAGARFGRIPDLLSWYRMRPNATWTGNRQYVRDGLRLVTQGHSADARVGEPAAAHAQGRAREDLPAARFLFLCRPAAMDLARGGDPRELLDDVPDEAAPDLSPIEVAHTMFHAAPLPSCGVPADWKRIWFAVEERLREFLIRLEQHAGACGLSRRAWTEIERLVLEQAVTERPVTVGTTHAVRREVTEPLTHIETSAAVERLECALSLEGEALGVVQLPVFDAFVPASVLADAIATQYAWRILGRWFAHTIFPRLETKRTDGDVEIFRGALKLGTIPAEGSRPFWDRAHDRIGWPLFLQEVWGCPGATLDDIYGRGIDACGPDRRVGGWTAVEVSEEIPRLVTHGSSVLVVLTAGGRAVEALRVASRGGRIPAVRLRASLTEASGMELCRVAVREALLGASLRSEPEGLRARLAVRAAALKGVVAPLADLPPSTELLAGWPELASEREDARPDLILARRPGPVGSSASRRASLPVSAAKDLEACAEATGELAIRTRSSSRRALYAPGLMWRAGSTGERSAHEPSTLERARSWFASAMAKRSGAAATGVVTERLPILMYHRVAASGASATARYRIAPDAFEAQLAMLRDEGFKSIDLEDWRQTREARRALSGRSVVFTFDDGCRDFATAAWPLLRRYGFRALVFVVTGRVGKTASWDARRGEEVALLDWDEIRRLAADGVAFGSHAATHRRLSGLAPDEIVREAARSRATLAREVGRTVDTIAYPHGASDALVQHIAGACGYAFGLSCEPGLADYDAPLLALPRIEVRGDSSLAELRASMGLTDSE